MPQKLTSFRIYRCRKQINGQIGVWPQFWNVWVVLKPPPEQEALLFIDASAPLALLFNEQLSWWRHQMEIFSVLLAICAGNSPVTGEFPTQRPVPLSFDVFLDLRLKKGWVNNPEADDFRRQRAHYDVTMMFLMEAFVLLWVLVPEITIQKTSWSSDASLKSTNDSKYVEIHAVIATGHYR